MKATINHAHCRVLSSVKVIIMIRTSLPIYPNSTTTTVVVETVLLYIATMTVYCNTYRRRKRNTLPGQVYRILISQNDANWFKCLKVVTCEQSQSGLTHCLVHPVD